MFSQPITFLAEFNQGEQYRRPAIMHEYAVAGAKHLVLTDKLIEQCLVRPQLVLELEKEMQAEGLDFVDAHSVFEQYSDLCCPSERLFPLMVQMHKNALAICASLGVKTICIHVGNTVWRKPGSRDYFLTPSPVLQDNVDRVRRALNELLPVAEQLGITICIENIWHITNTPEMLLAYKKEFDTPALGFCYDAGHAHLMRKDRGVERCAPKDSWSKVGKPVPWDEHILEKMLDNVVICHLHGNDGIYDLHRNICDSDIDWKDVCEKLHRAPRLASIQSEVIPTGAKAAFSEIVSAFNRLIQ